MSADIIAAIKEDHKKLKLLLKEGLDAETNLEEKKYIFEKLAVQITAHSKSEEAVIYAQTTRNLETKKNAYEGFEEHALLELLIEEMKTEQNDDKWEAKFTVVCHLLEHHIKEEEANYLPKLKTLFNDEQRKEMGKEYKEMYERLVSAQENILEPSYPEHFRNH